MAQLYAQTEGLEFDALKKRTVPLLCRVGTIQIVYLGNTYLNDMQRAASMLVDNTILTGHLHPKAVPTAVLGSIIAAAAVR